MYLQEEYIQRHGLDVPVINHVTRGSLLLHSDDLGEYVLMLIDWKESQRHPGTYHISFHSPVHNGYERGKYFHKIGDVGREIEWDEYVPFLCHWAEKQIAKPIVGDKEVILASWEIFMLCCDGWFVDYAQPSLEKLIFRSLDDTDINQRFQGYQESLVYLSSEHPAMIKAFKYEILPHIQHYCHWLGRLIAK